MEDVLKIFGVLKDVAGPTIAIGISAFVYLWSQRDSRKKDGADADGQIEALAVYKDLVTQERAKSAAADARADQFAKERNDALQQIWELKGQLKLLTDTLTAQTAELHELRDQVRQLKDQINARP